MSSLIQIFGSIILATIPALIWGHIFYKRNPGDRKLIGWTFFVGAMGVFPILLYKFSWQFFPWMNAFKLADYYKDDVIGISNAIALPLSIILTFMIVGFIEENVKFASVKIVDDEDDIKSIDDAIELFIIAALGFSFTENILYFYNIWMNQGPQNLLLPFLFRSTFSTFAHLLFSGLLGYYYGIAHFATPILQEELNTNQKKWKTWLKKPLTLGKERLFYQQKMFEGLLLAIGLHAMFNIFLEMNLTFMIIPFLVGGYTTLNYLFNKKENHKAYGKLLTYVRNHPNPKTGIYFERSKVAAKAT